MDFILPIIANGEDKSSPFMNCIRNNYQHLRKWAKRTQTNAFRIYDRQLHHYQLAIDFYAGRFCVQYFSQDRNNPDPSEDLVREVEQTLATLFGAKEKEIYWRNRTRRAKWEQYEKAGNFKEYFSIWEYGVKFRINLLDYLDTGLFLDHRETRRFVASQAANKRVLNLFAYTCSFSVQAAFHGAAFTKSVDMSNTYTEWGRENFLLNDLSLKTNPIVRADCLKFLDAEIQSGGKYDLIVVDPPTISRSKKMEEMFDIQLDHPILLIKALQLLQKEGVLFFSTNSRKFALHEGALEGWKCQEVSHKTLPIDFLDPKIHRCWKISAWK